MASSFNVRCEQLNIILLKTKQQEATMSELTRSSEDRRCTREVHGSAPWSWRLRDHRSRIEFFIPQSYRCGLGARVSLTMKPSTTSISPVPLSQAGLFDNAWESYLRSADNNQAHRRPEPEPAQGPPLFQSVQEQRRALADILREALELIDSGEDD